MGLSFGLVAGELAHIFSESIAHASSEVEFKKHWGTLEELQKDIARNGKEVVEGIQGIMVLDYGLTSANADDEFAKISLVQNMFEAKELYGTYLFIYTMRTDLYKRLEEHFNDMPDSKYEGLSLHLSGDRSYIVGNILAILTYPYPTLVKGARELAIRNDERQKGALKVMDTRRFYSLVGKKEQIESEIRYLQSQLARVNQEFLQFGNEVIQRDLEYTAQDYYANVQISPDTVRNTPAAAGQKSSFFGK